MPDRALEHSARTKLFALSILVAAITILDLTKVNVAIPTIEHSLHASATSLQLIVSGFILTFGLFLVPMGRLGDQGMRRPLFLLGLTLFAISSLICAVAPTAEVLVVGRIIQGIAAGTQMPQVIGMIQELYTGRERGKAFGTFGAVIGIATAFGPTLGGLFIQLGGDENGWRGIFWMNIPLAGIALIALWRLMPRTSHAPRPGALSLDGVGIVLFSAMVMALMWPFLFTTGSGDDDSRRWLLLLAAAVLAFVFYRWERGYANRGHAPLVNFGLFRISSYRNGTAIIMMYFAAMPPMFLATTLYLQEELGFSALTSGMVSIGFALASSAASWLSGPRIHLYGEKMVQTGVILILSSMLGIGTVAILQHEGILAVQPIPLIIAGLMIFGGTGGGLVMAANQTLTLAEIPVAQAGFAGSVGQLGQRIGTAIGSSIMLAVYYGGGFRMTLFPIIGFFVLALIFAFAQGRSSVSN